MALVWPWLLGVIACVQNSGGAIWLTAGEVVFDGSAIADTVAEVRRARGPEMCAWLQRPVAGAGSRGGHASDVRRLRAVPFTLSTATSHLAQAA